MSEKAYIIAFVKVSDFEAFTDQYIIPAAPIIQKYNGVVQAASADVEVVEGSMPEGFGVIIVFDSMQNLKAFYADPAYQPLIKVRQSFGGSSFAFIPQGMGKG